MLHIKIKTNTYANVLIKSKITQKNSRIFRCVTGRDKRDAKRVDYLTLAGNNELISHIEPLTLFCFFFYYGNKVEKRYHGVSAIFHGLTVLHIFHWISIN
jgi:hypothetical protein